MSVRSSTFEERTCFIRSLEDMKVATGKVHENLAQVPELEALKAALANILVANGCSAESFEIISRQPGVYTSTFPTEILRCKFGDGTERQIFCKYHIKDLRKLNYGDHGGIAYEAAIYREILQHAQVSTPGFVGVHSDDHTRQVWLFLEYLEESEHVHKVDIQNGLLSAARWLGKFHAENEQRASSNEYSFLIRFDAEYYTGWIARTLEMTASYQDRFVWLPNVCNEFTKSIELLLSEPLTVIHGGFYPRNILVSNGKVYPVDWESVAIAAGEIDVATLTEGWRSDVAQECEYVYQSARWPDGSPDVFPQRMKLARMYMEFRWLGDRPQWTRNEGPWRIESMGRLAKALGFLS